jgi:hypothetical protein
MAGDKIEWRRPPLRRTGLHLPGTLSTKRPEPDGSAAPIDRPRRHYA